MGIHMEWELEPEAFSYIPHELSVLPHRELTDHRALSAFCSVPENEISAISSNTEIATDCAAHRRMKPSTTNERNFSGGQWSY